jgi:hypothetical protein
VDLIEPLLPKKQRRFRYPGRKRLSDRQALQGILFVLHNGIAWTYLSRGLGFGSGVTCWRRLDEWQRAGVWERLHAELLGRLRAAGEIEWSPAPRGCPGGGRPGRPTTSECFKVPRSDAEHHERPSIEEGWIDTLRPRRRARHS